MAKEIVMPKLGMTMEEGILSRWLVDDGQRVRAGEPIMEVETDKVTMEVEAESDGIVHKAGDYEGATLPVGAIVGHLLAPGEAPPVEAAMTAEAPALAAAASVTPPDASPAAAGHVLRASPAARRLSREQGVDLHLVQGSGPQGRIQEADVRAYLEGASAAPPSAIEPVPAMPETAAVREEASGVITEAAALVERVPLPKVRRIAGARLTESFTQVPHFYLTAEADMAEAARLRATLPEKPSYTALLVRAVAAMLVRHPALNASVRGEEIWRFRSVNIGIATATPEGLLVPVIREAERKSLPQIMALLKELREKAESRRFTPNEYAGGTFTISNLGMYGIQQFTAIINPPEAAILAVGAIVDRPVARDGDVTVRPVMQMTLSIDHRALDGVEAAAFLADLRAVLENPYLLL